MAARRVHGGGQYEAFQINNHSQVKITQKAIKHALTERFYAFEEARRVAVTDPEVDLDAEPGTQAYTPIYSDVYPPHELPIKLVADSQAGGL